MQRVFVCFLEEIEDSKKAFRNYLTYKNKIRSDVSYGWYVPNLMLLIIGDK